MLIFLSLAGILSVLVTGILAYLQYVPDHLSATMLAVSPVIKPIPIIIRPTCAQLMSHLYKIHKQSEEELEMSGSSNKSSTELYGVQISLFKLCQPVFCDLAPIPRIVFVMFLVIIKNIYIL